MTLNVIIYYIPQLCIISPYTSKPAGVALTLASPLYSKWLTEITGRMVIFKMERWLRWNSPPRAVTMTHHLQLPQAPRARAAESRRYHFLLFLNIWEVTLVTAGQAGVFDVHFSTVLQLCLPSTFNLHSHAKVRSSALTSPPAASSSL